MFISDRELLMCEVHLRAIIQFYMAEDFGELAYLVDLIADDDNLRKGAKRLLLSLIDYLIRYHNHEE